MLTHPKILVWGAYNFEKKSQKQGSGMSLTCNPSPVKTKLMVIETSNMAQNDC